MLFGLSTFLPESILTLYDNLEFFIRILFSGILGAVVGLERTRRQKEAGVRTHCIVAVTSAVFMILSKYAFLDMLDITGAVGAKGADPSRIASQVVTGISFLGAGVIFRHKDLSITGLTTAAGLWATSAMGMAVGAGLYWVGMFETIGLVVAQIMLHRHPIGNDAKVAQEVVVQMEDDMELLAAFDRLVAKYHGKIADSEIIRENEHICVKAVVRLEEQIPYSEAVSFLESHKGVYRISV